MSAGLILPFTGVGLPPAAMITTVAGQNINALATNNVIAWDSGSFLGPNSHFTFVGPNTIQVIQDGWVAFDIGLSYVCFDARYNGRVYARLNGVPLTQRGKMGYVRNASGHNESTLTVSGMTKVFPNDLITVAVDRESVITGAANLNAGESWMRLIYTTGA